MLFMYKNEDRIKTELSKQNDGEFQYQNITQDSISIMTIPVKIATWLPRAWPCGLGVKGKKSGTSQKKGWEELTQLKGWSPLKEEEEEKVKSGLPLKFFLKKKSFPEAPLHHLHFHLIAILSARDTGKCRFLVRCSVPLRYQNSVIMNAGGRDGEQATTRHYTLIREEFKMEDLVDLALGSSQH